MNSKLQAIGTHECREWSGKIFSKHRGVDGFLKSQYIKDARSRGSRAANQHLGSIDEALTFTGFTSAALYDEEIKNLSSVRAIQARGMYLQQAKKNDTAGIAEKLTEFCELHGVVFPLKITRNDTPAKIAGKIISAAKRVQDEKWWLRKLRTLMKRQTESVLRSLGFVREGKSPYVSNWAYKRWAMDNARNRKTLGRMEAVTKDENGQEVVCDLLEKVDASNANPEIREAELKGRVAGYEEVAKGLGLAGSMFTLTTPSRFHPYHHFGGKNKNFDGSTPRDAMDYMNEVWARIRTAWARKGIKAFGLRTVEPHHDGTPHSHIALFFSPEQIDQAWEIFHQYALEESPDEPGALEHRATRLDMDPSKGSLMGYVLKYICKNLTGGGIDWDLEAQVCSTEGAKRATAWASIWGIRQFQFIGSVSVTVWRELRRLTDAFEGMDADLLENLRAAADEGNWAGFVELMGGAYVSRNDQPLRPQYSPENPNVENQYYEPVKKLVGLWLQPVARALGRYISTRDKVWVIREKSFCVLEEAKPPPSDLCQ